MSARSKKSKQSESEMSTSSRRTTSSGFRTDTARQRSTSPLNIARTEEKEELAHLNDRLAHYIDYVRKLELDKETLKRKIRSFTEERMVRLFPTYSKSLLYSNLFRPSVHQTELFRLNKNKNQSSLLSIKQNQTIIFKTT